MRYTAVARSPSSRCACGVTQLVKLPRSIAFDEMGLKRCRSSSSDSEISQEDFYVENVWDQSALQGAEVLRCLKNAKWHSEDSESDLPEWSCNDMYEEEVKARKPGYRDSRSPRSGQATRSYVWRGPCRGGPAKQIDHATSVKECDSGELDRDGFSSEEEGGTIGGHKQRDKEWAALTTWLRMNLHHPRTNKRQVLFVGNFCPETRSWSFNLNPALSWDDVSPETKLRLKNLPQETEAAFARKYPSRPTLEWVKKTQKYKPQGSSHSVTVPMSDMIGTLQSIYYQYEGDSKTAVFRCADVL